MLCALVKPFALSHLDEYLQKTFQLIPIDPVVTEATSQVRPHIGGESGSEFCFFITTLPSHSLRKERTTTKQQQVIENRNNMIKYNSLIGF